MAYEKKVWKDRVSEYPTRRTFVLTELDNTYDVRRAEGTVAVPGDAFSAENMNDLEDRIAAGFAEKADLVGGKVPADQLPEMNYIPLSAKGKANGVASLDGSGKVPKAQLPAELDNVATVKVLYMKSTDDSGGDSNLKMGVIGYKLGNNRWLNISGNIIGQVIDAGTGEYNIAVSDDTGEWKNMAYGTYKFTGFTSGTVTFVYEVTTEYEPSGSGGRIRITIAPVTRPTAGGNRMQFNINCYSV